MARSAIIIGAGPAGLTAALELLRRTDCKPIIFESDVQVGGISKTVNYKGNRMDIGGHRFFSKSDRVMQWWQEMMPIAADDTVFISYRNQTTSVTPAKDESGADSDKVMLVRPRLSRIYFLRKFFKYPVSLEWQTIHNLGLRRMIQIGYGYVMARIFPRTPERTLEDFFINRFGRELYLTFFKDYTEKVWGKPCAEISAEWGAQRIKGLSLRKAIAHAAKQLILKKDASVDQKKTETSLIERFLYPKFGPGQMWETVADEVCRLGGEIHFDSEAVGWEHTDNIISGVKIRNKKTGLEEVVHGDFFFSTMPVRDLIKTLSPAAPNDVAAVAAGLEYRDFITVGLLLKKMNIKFEAARGNDPTKIPDNWVYIQERDVRIGRLQVFNNWSPFLVKDQKTIWLGLEYFCNEGDDLWSMSDETFKQFAIDELIKIDLIDPADVLDVTLLRVPKTYPGYFGTYDKFDVIKKYISNFSNLFLIGRNGMHRYNNSDHSMLTAMTAVDNIVEGISDKENIWAVNTEGEYHEEKK
jgi:protoporphyrinogen oxidase